MIGMGLFRNDGPQPWHPANDDLKKEVVECIKMTKEKGQDISRLALRYSIDKIDADIVLCGTARVNELESNIKNAITPLTDEEQKTQDEILEKLKNLQGHWEGRELEAYRNRLADIPGTVIMLVLIILMLIYIFKRRFTIFSRLELYLSLGINLLGISRILSFDYIRYWNSWLQQVHQIIKS